MDFVLFIFLNTMLSKFNYKNGDPFWHITRNLIRGVVQSRGLTQPENCRPSSKDSILEIHTVGVKWTTRCETGSSFLVYWKCRLVEINTYMYITIIWKDLNRYFQRLHEFVATFNKDILTDKMLNQWTTNYSSKCHVLCSHIPFYKHQ